MQSPSLCETLEAVMVVAAVCESLAVAAAIFELQGAQVVTVAIEEALDGTVVTVRYVPLVLILAILFNTLWQHAYQGAIEFLIDNKTLTCSSS